MAQRKRSMMLFWLPFVAAVPLVLWNVFHLQITRFIGNTGWTIGLVVLIVAVVVFAVVFAFAA